MAIQFLFRDFDYFVIPLSEYLTTGSAQVLIVPLLPDLVACFLILKEPDTFFVMRISNHVSRFGYP